VAAGAFVLYFGLLLVSDAQRPDTHGLFVNFDASGAVVEAVAPGSPAEAAGLRPGDRIVSYAGRAVPTRLDWLATDVNLRPGVSAGIVARRGDRTVEISLPFTGRYVRFPPRPESVALGIALAGQLLTLLLACLVAFKRPLEPLARLGAWLLGSVSVFTIVLPFGFADRWHQLPAPISWLFWLPFVSGGAPGVLFFLFCCHFPRPVFHSPWLAAAWCVPALVPLAWHVGFGISTVTQSASQPIGTDWSIAVAGANVVYLGMGLGVLARQYREASQPDAERRLRVLLAGCAVACAACLAVALRFWLRPTPTLTHSLLASPVTLVGVPLMLALPLSIAYTILRQRLFDVSLIVRQGVRYALARRLLLSLAPLLVVALVADLALHGREPLFDLLRARGWLYAVTAALLVGVLVHRDHWLTALDRRFFRASYNAERLLRDVAAKLREERDPRAAVAAVVQHVDRALAPRGVSALMWTRGDAGYQALASAPVDHLGFAPDPAGRLVGLARLLGRPIDLSPDADTWIGEHLPPDEARSVFESAVELLVPVVVEDTRHVLLLLGPRKSEVPYSADDVALIEAVASNLSLVMERWTPTPPHDGPCLAECPVCGACLDTSLARCPADRSLLVATDLPPIVGGRYRIDARLGAGGMGTVYQAHDIELGRTVALKVLAEHLVGSADAARRFRLEAQASAAFEHPHVVTVHDVGVTPGGRAYLVLERLSGQTLRARIDNAPLDPREALRIAGDVADVLASAHARGLVHRDLKPENIFLAHLGRTETTKVLDFGIVKALAPADAVPETSTREDVLLGSVPYMAPEQLDGGVVHPSWDLWALAVTTHEMLTGRRPRAAEPLLVPLSPPLAAFFAATLSEDPAARPSTADAFRAALAAAIAGDGTPA
jgi:hypothetical protein